MSLDLNLYVILDINSISKLLTLSKLNTILRLFHTSPALTTYALSRLPRESFQRVFSTANLYALLTSLTLGAYVPSLLRGVGLQSHNKCVICATQEVPRCTFPSSFLGQSVFWGAS
jgi:hypothetical protein